MSTGAKGRLEEELGKLESLLRLLDDFEHNRQDQKLLMMLSQKLKVIVPELRKLSLDPSFKTPECAPLLVTLGQGIKRVQTALTSLRAQGLALPPVHSDSDKQLGAEQTQDNDQHRQQQEAVLQIQQQQQQQQAIQRQEYMRQQEQEEQREEQRKQQQQQEQQQKQQLERQKQQEKQKQEQPLQPSQLSQQQPQVRTDWSRESRRSVDEGERDVPTAQPSPRSLQLAEPKPLKGFLKKRGDKGLVKGYKVRYFEQRGDKIMYYLSDRAEDMKQVVGWIDLTKMLSVERSDEGFCVRTTGRVYALAVASGRADSTDAQTVLNYWIAGLTRWKQYRQDSIERMNRAPPSSQLSPGRHSVSPPKSSVWSGMSVISDDEDSSAHLSYLAARLSAASSHSSVSVSAPSEAASPPEPSPGPAPASTFELSPLDSPASRSGSLPGVRKSASARKLDFDEAPPVSAATTAVLPPYLVKQKSIELVQLQSQHQEMTLRCEELARQLQAANARCLHAETEVDVVRKLLREREAELEEVRSSTKHQLHAEQEKRETLEAENREAKARRAMAEEELQVVSRDLASRELLVSDLRGKLKQEGAPVSAELARMGTSKQGDVVAFLSRELEHEKDANEAHQQRVRFLAGQLAQLERQTRGENELREAQMSALQERLAKEKSARGEGVAVEELKREYFQALGVGMKLNLAMQGQNANLDVSSLFEEVRDTLPFQDWNRFLSLKLSLDLQPKKRESLTAELTQLFRKKATNNQ